MIVSIVVPIYKGEKYIPGIIELCKNNLKKLNIDTEIELILVNDFPQTDINEYIPDRQKKYCNNRLTVKCINNMFNRGIHASRIVGIEEAAGEYVLMLDQDDKITDNYIVSQLSRIDNADMIVANGITELPAGNRHLYKYAIMQYTVKSIWFNSVFNCRITSPGQCLIKKSSIPSEWRENIIKTNGADDYLLWLMMLSKKRKIEINREPLYIHCYTSENTSLDAVKMNQSVREAVSIAKKTNSVTGKYIRKIEKRLEHECGEKRKLFYSLEEILRKTGEKINKL